MFQGFFLAVILRWEDVTKNTEAATTGTTHRRVAVIVAIFVHSLVTSSYINVPCFWRGTSHITQVGILLRSYLLPDIDTNLRRDTVETASHIWTDGLSKDNHPTTLATYLR